MLFVISALFIDKKSAKIMITLRNTGRIDTSKLHLYVLTKNLTSYTGKQGQGGGRMVNLWMDKDGSIGLESRGELMYTKSICASTVKNCAVIEGVFNH